MRKRFPSLKSIVQYGLLRSCEEDKVREAWWSPVLWSMELLAAGGFGCAEAATHRRPPC